MIIKKVHYFNYVCLFNFQDSCRLVGGSKFYEVMEGSASADVSTPSPTEKHDHMKPIESDDEGTHICTLLRFLSSI